MNGKSIVYGLASAPGPDWLKDVVRLAGPRIVVHNELKSLLNSLSQVSFILLQCHVVLC